MEQAKGTKTLSAAAIIADALVASARLKAEAILAKQDL